MSTISSDYNQYITSDWLQAHSGAIQVFEQQPDFLEFLNSQPDYAQLFSESREGAQEAAQAAIDAGAVSSEAMDLLIGQASLAQGTMAVAEDDAIFTDYNEYMTSDWLRSMPQAALEFSQNPDLVQFFNDNPDYAQMLVQGPESGRQAMQAAYEALGQTTADSAGTEATQTLDSLGQTA